MGNSKLGRWAGYYVIKDGQGRDFPHGPMVRTPHFHCWGPHLIPVQGMKILQAAQHGQKVNK